MYGWFGSKMLHSYLSTKPTSSFAGVYLRKRDTCRMGCCVQEGWPETVRQGCTGSD
jgi:hypothetical protein